MRIKILEFVNKGKIDDEFLLLEVRENTNLGEYALFCAGYKSGSVTTGLRHALWFPDKSVSKGDLIIVSTNSGSTGESRNDDGTKYHFLYWGLDHPIWNQDDRAPVLLHAPEWESKAPDSL